MPNFFKYLIPWMISSTADEVDATWEDGDEALWEDGTDRDWEV